MKMRAQSTPPPNQKGNDRVSCGTESGTWLVEYANTYQYSNPDNPYAVTHIQDALGTHYDFDWDANGNLIHSVGSSSFYERRLCWTEVNRLQGYWELSDDNGGIAAYYNYAAGGDRNYKLTSPRINASQNAANIMQHPTLVYPTLYASSLITFNKGGYTKHYFEGANRVCSKIGGGFAAVSMSVVDSKVPYLSYDYTSQYSRQREGVDRTFIECLGVGGDVPNAIDLYDVIKHEQQRMEKEPAFYYHSDHLGSAAYLTNDAGQVTQTLNYLPYGEDWVDIQNYAETRYPRLGIYAYNGKERDYESSFHYYGARYYWSDVLTGWLSVDPMADKYPSISPYAYCVWNPIILSDPDGDSVILSDDARIIHEKYYNVNKTYTDVYNQLNDPSNNTLFVFGKKGDTPNINNATEGGTVVEYFPPDEGVDPYENFAGDIYLVQWGEAHSELGGDESHVFLEEMYHAKQILDYGNNNGTIEKEVRAKEFAVKVNPYVIHSCKSNGYDNVPTQLSIIQGFNYSESSKFLKEGMHNVRVKNVWGGWEYGSIPGAYKDFPWK